MGSKHLFFAVACLILVSAVCQARGPPDGKPKGLCGKKGLDCCTNGKRPPCSGNSLMCSSGKCVPCGLFNQVCCQGPKSAVNGKDLRPCRGIFNCTVTAESPTGVCLAPNKTGNTTDPNLPPAPNCTPVNLALQNASDPSQTIPNPYPFNVSACSWRENSTNPDKLHLVYVLTGNLSSITLQPVDDSHSRTDVTPPFDLANVTYFKFNLANSSGGPPAWIGYILSSTQWDLLADVVGDGNTTRDTTSNATLTVDDDGLKGISRLSAMSKPDKPPGKPESPGNGRPDKPGGKPGDKPGEEPENPEGPENPEVPSPVVGTSGGGRTYHAILTLPTTPDFESVDLRLLLSAYVAVSDAAVPNGTVETLWV